MCAVQTSAGHAIALADPRQERTTVVADGQPRKVRPVATRWIAQASLSHRSTSRRPMYGVGPMTVSPIVNARSSKLLPRLRSRGGRGAGSFVQPGRRNPRAAHSTGDGSRHRPPSSTVARSVDTPTDEIVEAARSKLMAQRRFRIHQLDQLAASLPDPATDAARAQIHAALRAAACSVILDIDAALRRIRQGNYGYCPQCGSAMSTDRLIALPMAPMCGSCQRTRDLPSGGLTDHLSTEVGPARDPSACRTPSARWRDPTRSSHALGRARNQRAAKTGRPR